MPHHRLGTTHRLTGEDLRVNDLGRLPVLGGEPVIGQMQVDPAGLDGGVAGLGLDRPVQHIAQTRRTPRRPTLTASARSGSRSRLSTPTRGGRSPFGSAEQSTDGQGCRSERRRRHVHGHAAPLPRPGAAQRPLYAVADGRVELGLPGVTQPGRRRARRGRCCGRPRGRLSTVASRRPRHRSTVLSASRPRSAGR
jgi:hypothetical protein